MNQLKTRFDQAGKHLFAVLVLTSFYVFATAPTLSARLVKDPDIWWHLRTGQWIVEHHALPATDPFSHTMQGTPWVVYSWLYEVLVYLLVRWLGLAGVVCYTTVLVLVLIVALFVFVRQTARTDLRALGYVGLGLFGIATLCTPRPWLFTFLFFVIEYTLLIRARRLGRTRALWWLVPIYALWANLHIQFIYGLFLLGFDSVQDWLDQVLQGDFRRAQFRANFDPQRWVLVLGCFLATLVTPYHIRLYQIVWEYASQTRLAQYISEMQPLNFYDLENWAVLSLVIWALFRLGQRHLPKPSQLVLLLIGILVAFRSSRDVWFVVFPALAILSDTDNIAETVTHPEPTPAFPLSPIPSLMLKPWVQGAAVLLFGLAVLSTLPKRHLDNATLQARVAERFPVEAARVIEARGYQGPLYNLFDWGGYLIWRLPQHPVSMDGRGNIYGQDRIANNIDTWRGDHRWAQDPELAAARIVVADINQPLSELLRQDPRFELVYEDKVAALFLPRAQPLAQR